MRVSLCDRDLIFVESLAHVLQQRGDEVVAMTSSWAEALAAAARVSADVLILGAGTATDVGLGLIAQLGILAPNTAVVLLADERNGCSPAEAAAFGIRAVAQKRQQLSAVLQLLDRVHADEHFSTKPHVRAASRSGRPSDRERIARFISPREREVLCALVRGEDTQQLARSLGISVATARSHVQSVLGKLGTHTRLGAVTTAVRVGLVEPRTAMWLTDEPLDGQLR